MHSLWKYSHRSATYIRIAQETFAQAEKIFAWVMQIFTLLWLISDTVALITFTNKKLKLDN